MSILLLKSFGYCPKTPRRSYWATERLSSRLTSLYKCTGCGCKSGDTPCYHRDMVFCELSRNANCGLLTCAHCDKKYSSLELLKSHLDVHGQLRYSSGLCEIKHSSREKVEDHIKIYHNINSLEAIPVLPNRKNSEIDDFIIMPKKVESIPDFVPEDRRYRCSADDCTFTAAYAVLLEVHWKQHHSGEHKCFHCNWPVSFGKFREHMQLHDNQLYKCEYCPSISTDKFEKDEHFLKKHSSSPKFKIIRDLNSPYSAGEKWLCLLCSNGLADSELDVKSHCKEQHNLMKKFKCSMCPIEKDDYDDIKAHVITLHNSNVDKVITVYKQLTTDIRRTYSRPALTSTTSSIPMRTQAQNTQGVEARKAKQSDPSTSVLRPRAVPPNVMDPHTQGVEARKTQTSLTSCLTEDDRIAEKAVSTDLSKLPMKRRALMREVSRESVHSKQQENEAAIFNYYCEYCQKNMCLTRKAMEEHLAKDMNYKKYKCKFCGFLGYSESEIKDHFVSKHLQYAVTQSAAYEYAERAIKPLLDQQEKENVEPEVSSTASTLDSDEYHNPGTSKKQRLSQNNDQNFKCQECLIVCETAFDLLLHKHRIHQKPNSTVLPTAPHQPTTSLKSTARHVSGGSEQRPTSSQNYSGPTMASFPSTSSSSKQDNLAKKSSLVKQPRATVVKSKDVTLTGNQDRAASVTPKAVNARAVSRDPRLKCQECSIVFESAYVMFLHQDRIHKKPNSTVLPTAPHQPTTSLKSTARHVSGGSEQRPTSSQNYSGPTMASFPSTSSSSKQDNLAKKSSLVKQPRATVVKSKDVTLTGNQDRAASVTPKAVNARAVSRDPRLKCQECSIVFESAYVMFLHQDRIHKKPNSTVLPTAPHQPTTSLKSTARHVSHGSELRPTSSQNNSGPVMASFPSTSSSSKQDNLAKKSSLAAQPRATVVIGNQDRAASVTPASNNVAVQPRATVVIGNQDRAASVTPATNNVAVQPRATVVIGNQDRAASVTPATNKARAVAVRRRRNLVKSTLTIQPQATVVKTEDVSLIDNQGRVASVTSYAIRPCSVVIPRCDYLLNSSALAAIRPQVTGVMSEDVSLTGNQGRAESVAPQEKAVKARAVAVMSTSGVPRSMRRRRT